MAKWAFWMFIATTAPVLVGIAGLILIARTLFHTRRAAEHTEKMLGEAKKATAAAENNVAVAREGQEIELRPYVTVNAIECISDNAQFWEGEISIGVDITFENHGPTPAYNVDWLSLPRLAFDDVEQVLPFGQTTEGQMHARIPVIGPRQVVTARTTIHTLDRPFESNPEKQSGSIEVTKIRAMEPKANLTFQDEFTLLNKRQGKTPEIRQSHWRYIWSLGHPPQITLLGE